MDCLVYAQENGCPWDSTTFQDAAYTCTRSCDAGRRLRCQAYAHERGCPADWGVYVGLRAHLELRAKCATKIQNAVRRVNARRRADVKLVFAGRWGRAAPRPPAGSRRGEGDDDTRMAGRSDGSIVT